MIKYIFAALIYVMMYLFSTKGDLRYALGSVVSFLIFSILFLRELIL